MQQPPGSTSSTVLQKILIPVITTVLGATAIYFLGFNNKSSGRSDIEQMFIAKEATLKAWKSFVTTQNISYKNVNSLSDEYGERLKDIVAEKGLESTVPLLKEYKEVLFKELKKFNQDMEDIQKNKDIDPQFISMMNRTMDNIKEEEKKATTLFDNLISLAKSDLDASEKTKEWQKEGQKFLSLEAKADERAANEAEAIAKTLAERYNQPFDLNELLVYVDYKEGKDKKNEDHDIKTDGGKETAPAVDSKGSDAGQSIDPDADSRAEDGMKPTESLLTGNWEMTGGLLELSGNGKMHWAFDNRGYTSGTWELSDGKLEMNATNPDTKKTILLVGFLSAIDQNAFTMTIMSSPKEVYRFKRRS
jgi:uncharacterized protein (UPF0333 family)